jgi:hypothetical protein
MSIEAGSSNSSRAAEVLEPIGAMTDAELNAVGGGAPTPLGDILRLGCIAAAQTGAGVKWAYVNTNAYEIPW